MQERKANNPEIQSRLNKARPDIASHIGRKQHTRLPPNLGPLGFTPVLAVPQTANRTGHGKQSGRGAKVTGIPTLTDR